MLRMHMNSALTRPWRARLGLAFAAIAWLAAPAWAAVLPAPVQVSASAWAWIGPYEGPSRINQGFRMNLGFVVGRDAVAVVETGYTQQMAEEMVAAIGRITPLPIRFAINTNSQPHRFMGNEVFRAAGARIIASREAVQRMAKDGGDFAGAIAAALELSAAPRVPEAPDEWVEPEGRAGLDLGGGVTVELLHFGRGHTGGGLVVQVNPDRTVFTGDLLYAGRLPAILPDSQVIGWIAGFERLRTLAATRFVPGHGQPGPLAAFEQPTLNYLRALKNHMDAAVKAGVDASAAVRSFDASPWRELVNFSELNQRNASLAYLESEREGF
jgi:glyoxylase-like metal-dependent hydrolase (beta-lactamase superfamily II)